MIITIIFLIISGAFYHQAFCTNQYPIGPHFLSPIATKQRLYYNNIGIRLDCSAVGNPLPVFNWFRTNGTDDQSWINVQSSEFIHTYDNGSLFIRPFREYFKPIHAGLFVCQAENAAGSIQTLPIQVKPQIHDTYEIEVKNPYGFEESSVIISCEVSPPSASSYVNVIGWLEKIDDRIIQLDLKPKTKYNLLANKNLIIHNLTKSDDNRSYACIVNNHIDNHTKQSRFKSLRVRDRSPFGPELSMKNNTEYRSKLNDTIELPCGIVSLSNNLQISWWKDGIELTNIEENLYNNSLIFPISSITDSGHYTCQIEDDALGRMTSTISLNVIHSTKCDINIQQITISAGSDSELICRINSIEDSSIRWQWYHNSVLLANKLNQYMIINATRQHMGMYQCCYISTSPEYNSCCAQTQVRVINSPPFVVNNVETYSNSIVILPENNYYRSIDLNFTIYADPLPEITVLKDGQKLSKNHSINYLPSGDIFVHYSIHVSNIEDTGLYEYLIENFFGSISLSKHVNLNKQKPYIQPLRNQTVRNGEQFTLKCYGSGQPNLRLQWIDQTNNRIVNASSTSPVLFTSTNTIPNVYTCQVINPYGEVSSRLHVAIQVPAKIISVTSNQTVKINSKLRITCLAEGDNELKLILKNSLSNQLNVIEHKFENKKKISFMIDNVQMSDSGLYECYAKNNYSEDRSIFAIIVQTVPDKIENIFNENSEGIFWIKPFDGNSKILKYILSVQSRESSSRLNETIIIIDDGDTTNYRFENIFSKCMFSVTIQAVNSIGPSLPSEPFNLAMNPKQLLFAPYNLTATNISSKSLILTWQYPSFHICDHSPIEFFIEINDQYNHSVIRTHNYRSTVLNINQLRSFTFYTFVIYALNELGPSPKSNPLKIRTLESVPRAMIADLTVTLLNSSTAHIKWNFQQEDFQHLNGKFRTFTVSIYKNFDMSTLKIIETVKTNVIVYNLQSSSQYYISVAICNYFDCGSSSTAIDITTPSSSFDTTTTTLHPINKPLTLNCPGGSNNPVDILYPKLSEVYNDYQCGSKLIHIQYYDKPTLIHANVHYSTSNEIGLKLSYPPEIIESVTITYKIKENSFIYELNISPPLNNIRLTNLSCGNLYEIMIYTSNQAGFSSTEYLIARTDGSIPSVIQPKDLIRTVTDNYIILNMAKWIINECPILSYEIEIVPIKNSNEYNSNRYFSFKYPLNEVKIDHLQSDHQYRLNIKVNSQPGENFQSISFRTEKSFDQMKMKYSQHFILIIFTLTCFMLIFLAIFVLLQLRQKRLKRTEVLLHQNRILKPMLCSAFSHPNHRHHHKRCSNADNDFTIENYTNENRSTSFTSEDSHGNINPYAVTVDTSMHQYNPNSGLLWKEGEYDHHQIGTDDTLRSTTSSDRYFRPIIVESSVPSDQNPLKPSPRKENSDNNSFSNVLSTVSSPGNKHFSPFVYVSTARPIGKKISHNNHSLSSADSGVHSSFNQSPRCPLHNSTYDHSLLPNQDNPLYATYDEKFSEDINRNSYKRQKYSLV